ncbi:BTB/POZ and MATH domain-containing protein 1-like [Miscanthus floridulus]|uniref:BTB/POZ and MATH domain-containing protein 1-like n=1 Tax=Miscanthus floridulus TaxID=154761 RepID=UPI0034584396
MPISSASAVGTGVAATGGTPPEQSASCIVAKTAAGLHMHMLTIDGYSRIKDGSDRRKSITSVTVYKVLHCEDRDVPSRLVAVPLPDMGVHLGRLLSSGVGADLTFVVAGETFAAHRYILAVRSPVLLEEIVSGCLTKRMEARVFKALLHYIYTDSLPEIDEGETTDMARHLIAAADRYSLDRLKLICEDMLCRCIDTSTVAATLALAEEYKCHGLKKACVQFLMSGSNLKAAMAAGGFEHLRSSCPSVPKELLAVVERG